MWILLFCWCTLLDVTSTVLYSCPPWGLSFFLLLKGFFVAFSLVEGSGQRMSHPVHIDKSYEANCDLCILAIQIKFEWLSKCSMLTHIDQSESRWFKSSDSSGPAFFLATSGDILVSRQSCRVSAPCSVSPGWNHSSWPWTRVWSEWDGGSCPVRLWDKGFFCLLFEILCC